MRLKRTVKVEPLDQSWGKYDEIVTPTEALTAVTEVLRALRLGPMEFGLWARRRPEDYHDTDFEVIPTENTIK